MMWLEIVFFTPIAAVWLFLLWQVVLIFRDVRRERLRKFYDRSGQIQEGRQS